jgi:hypothetical protein
MNKTERHELTIAVKAKAKAARMLVEQRRDEMYAHVEKQLSAVYKADHQLWADITAKAERAVAAADAQIAALCREHDIPENFRPKLTIGWYHRGENAVKERRDELRKTYYSQIDAQASRALAVIENRLADFQVRLAATALESQEAQEMLAAIPKVEDLLPLLSVEPRQLRLSAPQEDDDGDKDITYDHLDATAPVTDNRDAVTPTVTPTCDNAVTPEEPLPKERVCVACGKPVVSARADAQTCSPACRQKLHRQRQAQ